MEELKRFIMKEAIIRPGGVVIVSGFLNHRMDIALIDKIGKEFFRLFSNTKPDIILTAEASGIGIACLTARYFGVNVVFAPSLPLDAMQ
jgi:xanthine phosphoribosyltransferase